MCILCKIKQATDDMERAEAFPDGTDDGLPETPRSWGVESERFVAGTDNGGLFLGRREDVARCARDVQLGADLYTIVAVAHGPAGWLYA